MKNIFLFLITIFGLFVLGCDPMADINKELDTMADEDYIRDTFNYAREIAPDAYTLTDEDYELSSNSDVAKYKNFSAYALPKDYLPEILNKKFTATDAFAMAVTYNYYSKPVVDENGAYVISDDEYTEMNQYYKGFSNEDEAKALIGKLLDRKVYASEAGAEKTVNYNTYEKSHTRYIRVNADLSTEVLKDSVESYILTDTDYDDLSEPYGNFTFIEDAEAGVVTLAGLKNHTLPKSYSCEVYRNFYETFIVYLYNGSNWLPKQSVIATTETLNYALDSKDITNSTWWADPAIKITLGSADFDLYTETSTYQNFDLRSGNTPGTDKDKLVEMIGGMLDANHSPVDDQQYLVSYAYYDGSSGVATIRVIRTSGVWSEYVSE